MTRKCVLCKGTNYKRTYSFFSAPKDPEIRKKWQALIPIANYTVNDDTFVCSKHFRSDDIITHWVSGVPPNVITIKYKKCRLRVGAVPCLNFEDIDGAPKTAVTDDCSEFVEDEIECLIPQENHAEPVATGSQVIETHRLFDHYNQTIAMPIKSEKYNVIDDQSTNHFHCTEYVNVSDAYKSYISRDQQMQNSMNPPENDRFNELRNCYGPEYTRLDKVENHESVIDEELQESLDGNDDETIENAKIHCSLYGKAAVLSRNVKLEQDVQALNEELIIEDDDTAIFHTKSVRDNVEPNHQDVPEDNHANMRQQEFGENLLEALRNNSEDECGEENSDAVICDTMLFEDLLEIYTEVTLPQGWAFLVTSKGHTTTIVYLYMNVPTNHIPVVEKEVYVKSDMVLRCGAGNREINPFLHNLTRDGKNNKVRALSDIEELINELDQRHICAGGPSVQNFTEVEMQLAYVDGEKWRHVTCPIIINNGSLKCSKCVSLSSNVTRRNKNLKERSLGILKDQQKEIKTLQKLLKKVTRNNRRLEGIQLRFENRLKLLLVDSEELVKKRISSSNMPEIQKLMIKECLKASAFQNKSNAGYCETWIFLCLLLYVESPRMYRYMIVNNYMALPPMGTIRKYLNQIKIDPQFYNLFQRSVEPYQPVNEHNA